MVYSYDELQEMVCRWRKAIKEASLTGKWRPLIQYYTDDAEYILNLTPTEEYHIKGRGPLEQIVLGELMEGVEQWEYIYDHDIIDPQKGEVVLLGYKNCPLQRKDGTHYQVAGVAGCWFTYGGNFKWSREVDFFNLANVKEIILELAADGNLSPALKKRIAKTETNHALFMHSPNKPLGFFKKCLGYWALTKAYLFKT